MTDASPPPPGTVTPEERAETLRPNVVAAIDTVYDPEIPVSIWELGLVYDVAIRNGADVEVTMTLTTPHCPEAQYIPGRVEAAVREVPGVGDVRVEIVWEPPWTPDRMSEAARLELGYF